MKFEVLGPYLLETKSIIKKEHVVLMKEKISLEEETYTLLNNACGCYVFGIRSSGSSRITPWYVGKAERQSVISEATNDSHLQLYNEILDGYSRAIPALYFIPAITSTGRPRQPTKGESGMGAIDFLEDWLIATALKMNGDLWNIKKTKLLKELYVRGIFNPKKGDMNICSSSLKESLGI